MFGSMDGFSIPEVQKFLLASEGNEQECRNRENLLESSMELKQLCEMNGVTKEDFVQRKGSIESLQIFMTNPIEVSLVRFFPYLQTLQVRPFRAWGGNIYRLNKRKSPPA